MKLPLGEKEGKVKALAGEGSPSPSIPKESDLLKLIGEIIASGLWFLGLTVNSSGNLKTLKLPGVFRALDCKGDRKAEGVKRSPITESSFCVLYLVGEGQTIGAGFSLMSSLSSSSLVWSLMERLFSN